MSTIRSAQPTPLNVLTVQLSAPDLDALTDMICQITSQMDDPDQIAAIRMDEDACCAEVDIAGQAVDARRYH